MRIFKKFILLLIFALNAVGSFAQYQKTYFQIANEYFNDGKYDEAVIYYEKNLQFDIKKYGSNHIYIGDDYYFIGLSYLRLNKYDEAIENFNKALNIYESKNLSGDKKHLAKYISDTNIQIRTCYESLSDEFFEKIKQSNIGDKTYPKKRLFCDQKILEINLKEYGELHEYTAKAYYELVKDYSILCDYKNTLINAEKSLEINKKLFGENNENTAFSYKYIGLAYKGLFNYEVALDYLKKALDIERNVLGENNDVIAWTYFNIGEVYMRQTAYQDALSYYLKALEIRENVLGKEAVDTMFSYEYVGNVYICLGDFDRALSYFEKVLVIAKKQYSIEKVVVLYYSYFQEIYEKKKDYNTSLKYAEIILNETEKLYGNKHVYIGDAYYMIAKLYYYMDNDELAIFYNKKALEIYKNELGENSLSTANCLNNLSLCYKSINDYVNSIDCILESLEIKKNLLGDNNYDISLAYYNFASLLGYLDSQSAIYYFKKACDIWKKSQRYYNILNALKSIIFYKEIQDLDDLPESTKKELDNLKKQNGITEKFDKKDFIRQTICLTTEIAERASLDLTSLKSDILHDILPVYYYGIGFEAENGDFEKAFEYSESLRSRIFLDQVGIERALSLDGITDSERNLINEYITQISIARKEIEEEGNKSILERNNKKLSDAENNLSNAEKKLAKLDSEIGKRIPAYSALRNPKIVKAKDAQKWCGKDNAIVEYVIWNQKILDEVGYFKNLNDMEFAEHVKFGSYCIVVTNKKITVVPIDVNYDYAAAVSKLRDGIIPKRISPQPETVFEDVRNELYEKLIEPVLPYVKGKNNLVVVPDGSLAFLPFDVLRKDENSKMLCEQFAVSLSPSVSVSMISKSSKSNGNKVLAFGGAWYDSSLSSDEHRRTFSLEDKDRGSKRGFQSLETEMLIENQQQKEAIIQDIKLNGPSSYFEKKNLHWKDLPGTLTELNCLQKIFKSKDFSEFVQENASENKLKELSKNDELKNFSILHFACHGYFDRQISDMSSILFSEVSGKLSAFSSNDGYLTIPEVSTLNLNADIVCLSACETGLGEVKFGDGMTGLSRAFMVAGARHVGVTLWSVDDEATSEFMSKMYKKISGGKTYEQAYRQTKAEFMKSEDFSHPYYWAAFALYE
ncbi:CHAT domain-containing protein [uncultured Treponema sp.]|uniref:CHAT domain-containing protein n=1 Tax=uncultured Treponema sp. TaxID=162155 RepID=UPI0025FA88B4|nr:CHAT domain-containing protein [uncultured Treponema sp.]